MYLLDTNVIIDFVNAKLPVKAKNILLNQSPTISVITNIELFSSVNISENEINILKKFIELCTIYNTINKEILELTINIRKKYRVKLPDAIIAATAISNKLILITRNTVDFKNIEDLKLLNPYEL